jgi:D-alanyl-D-alanine carboxypeptidase (penicillin-binding protein 5/6)
VPNDVYATFPRGQESSLGVAADVAEPLIAPLDSGAPIGKLRVMLGGAPYGTYPLHVSQNVAEAGFFSRLVDDVLLWME